jgi:hypothetical protein
MSVEGVERGVDYTYIYTCIYIFKNLVPTIDDLDKKSLILPMTL